MIEIIAYVLIGLTFFISVTLTQKDFMSKFISTGIMIGIFVGMKNYLYDNWTFAYMKSEIESLFWVKYAIMYLIVGLI